MRAFCYTFRVVVHTIGHSTRTFPELLALLRAHAIRAVADVRRHPGSRRHPQFARDALAAALGDEGIAYAWLPALGGRRRARPDSPHVGWRVAAFRGYADHMETPEFERGLADLLAFAARRPTAVLCAEAVPWRCHRQLIADALVARGVEVRHVVGPAGPARHALPAFARLEGARIVYDGEQRTLAPWTPSRPRGDRS
jgi:uncharacterized protein (DUF488 family)